MTILGTLKIEDLPGGPSDPWAPYLRKVVTDMYGHELEQLHTWPHLEGDPCVDVERKTDQGTRAHRQFYRLFPRIAAAYELLVAELADRHLADTAYVFQAVPNVRIHYPQSRAVAEPHTDHQYGHQFGELTFWIPLTQYPPAEEWPLVPWDPALELEGLEPPIPVLTSSIWVADRLAGWDPKEYERLCRDGKYDEAEATLPGPVRMYPLPVRFGQVLVIDTVSRNHGNCANMTGQTRVSLDFRVLPRELLEENTRRESLNTKTPFRLGGYWSEPAA
jgi:hypothetical protein